MSTNDASDAIVSSVLIETLFLENYFYLSIFMLIRAIYSKSVLLTQFDSLYVCESSNLEKIRCILHWSSNDKVHSGSLEFNAVSSRTKTTISRTKTNNSRINSIRVGIKAVMLDLIQFDS